MRDRDPLPDIERVLGELNRQFAWAEPGTRFRVERFSGRPGSSLYMVSSGAGGVVDVLVKNGGEKWDSIPAGDIAAAMLETAEAIGAARLSKVSVPVPLAWTNVPKVVVSRYIEGVDLSTVLHDPDHALWGDTSRTLEEWLDSAGRALAAYHRNSTLEPSAYPSAERSLVAAATKLLIGRRRTRRLLPDAEEHLHARTYVDPNPSNFRRGTDGTVWLLDPPLRTRFGFVHEDLARFLGQAEKILRTRAHERLPRLREWFLGGYTSLGPPLDTPRDHALLELFRARFHLGVARARARYRPTRRTASRFAIVWAARRRTLHPMESHIR